MDQPGWDDVDDDLHALGAPCDAAEAHGLLCGLLALAVPSARSLWLERAAGVREPTTTLAALHDETVRQLDDASFGFELLLPPDEHASLAARTDALARWCTGFSAGVGLSGCSESALSEETREFLIDVTRLSQAEVASDEDDEAALAEVVEYVRVGVLLVRTESLGRAPAD